MKRTRKNPDGFPRLYSCPWCGFDLGEFVCANSEGSGQLYWAECGYPTCLYKTPAGDSPQTVAQLWNSARGRFLR
jgi:hypothetical protein